ncbi:hypothetical protein GGI23_002469 [Coemansia sp. RSA 2559]|nr:hypothetical protein GGI23_002469 [Coemansia sp. RSA 2559]
MLELCRSEWSAAESSVNSVLLALESHTALRPSESKQLAQKCRQVVGALYACVTSLATCAGGLDSADGHSLKVATKALHENATDAQTRDAVRDAIVAASALAELLRIFTRVSQQSWVNTRTQLAHAPSVPSPLSSGSTMLRHRRWVSEEIESEASSPTPGLRISVDGRPMDADTSSRAVESAHMRNRSESRLRFNDAPHQGPALRKSALSLRSRSPASQQPALPLSSGNNSDAGERSKQVRFVSTSTSGTQVDQGHLNELAQFLLQFKKAVAALQCALRDDATAGSSYASEIRGLVTAFVQISKLSSTTGMVKHYDRPTLAQFKTTTQAIKQLTPLLPKSS